MLKWSGIATVGALAMGLSPNLALRQAFAASGADASAADAVDLGSGDIGILNYAYALEQLEAAFYGQVLLKPWANISADDNKMIEAIHHHEIAHRDLFKAALGSKAIPDLTPDFSKVMFNDKMNVLTTAQTFEDLGVAAYNGAGALLQNTDYLLLAGKIVSVEARHATAIRSLIKADSQEALGSDVVDDKGLDRAMAPADVLKAAGPFIKTPVTANNLPTMSM